MLFTRKTRIPDFRKPRLEGIKLQTSEIAQYLGVILHLKLSLKRLSAGDGILTFVV